MDTHGRSTAVDADGIPWEGPGEDSALQKLLRGDQLPFGEWSRLIASLSPEEKQEFDAHMGRKQEKWDREEAKKRLDAKALALEGERSIRRSYLVDEIGPRFKDARLENYQVYDDEQKAVFDAIQAYAADLKKNVEAKKGLLLYGAAGCGKDHLLFGLGYLACQYLPVGAISGTEIMRGMMDEANLLSRFFQRNNPLQARLVIISDPVPPLAMPDWKMGLLFEFIDKIYKQNTPVWTSMNATSIEQAEERLTSPVFDRLADRAQVIKCWWPSFRTRHLAEGK